MRKTGRDFICSVCGATFHRAEWQIQRGPIRACSHSCRGKLRVGALNTFFRRHHNDDTKRRFSITRKGRNAGHHYGLGYRHTDEAKQRMSEALRRRWQEHGDEMRASLPRGENHPNVRAALPYPRYGRKGWRYPRFTKRQKREWRATECAKCGATSGLDLDHIQPISLTGPNTRENAQTLCRRCHRWKTKHVDLPQFYARLAAAKGA